MTETGHPARGESEIFKKTPAHFVRKRTNPFRLSQTGIVFAMSLKICIVYTVETAQTLLNGFYPHGKLWTRRRRGDPPAPKSRNTSMKVRKNL